MANVKYRESGVLHTYHEALEKLIKEDVIPTMGLSPWQEFRDRYLWTLECNDIYWVNHDPLMKLYTHFHDARKHYMSMDDALNLMMRLTPLQLSEKEAKYCYGMSKMTVMDEAEESTLKYKRLQYVELLEMIGRIADVKFRGSDMEGLILPTKIEFVLDEILTLVHEKRRPV